jgi:hypothetical protein
MYMYIFQLFANHDYLGLLIQLESNEISILENLKHQYEEELRAISYPLYGIGFLSQAPLVLMHLLS